MIQLLFLLIALSHGYILNRNENLCELMRYTKNDFVANLIESIETTVALEILMENNKATLELETTELEKAMGPVFMQIFTGHIDKLDMLITYALKCTDINMSELIEIMYKADPTPKNIH
jgi:hypothetical protein